MEQDKDLDIKLWKEVKLRIDSDKPNLAYEDFQIMCELHSKYMKHKYHEPNFCGCNAKRINQWIKEVSKCLE